jgi:hypothetical protein
MNEIYVLALFIVINVTINFRSASKISSDFDLELRDRQIFYFNEEFYCFSCKTLFIGLLVT